MLLLTLLCVGRSKAGPERDLASRYLERARQIGRPRGIAVEMREIPESRSKRASDRKADEGEAIRALLGPAIAQAIVFDEIGESLGSRGFAECVRLAMDKGERSLSLVIGGPDGLDPSIRDGASKVISLGTMTWPHQLVRIMVAEQIYRAATILSGHPYHRG